MEQTVFGDFGGFETYLTENAKNVLFVHDDALKYLKLKEKIEKIGSVKLYHFTDFQPNPLYDSVVSGIRALRENDCDCVLAVGGGSAIDVAKCIKLYANLDESENYLKQTIVPNDIKLFAVPTTAGTGSEATRFAVIYYDGEKQSVASEEIIPSVVLLDASVLETLPPYQKRATMCDALCHALESFWSVNSTPESRELSKEALGMILKNMNSYLSNERAGNEAMLKAANIAGRAINITQTTAGHAMCYKMTSLYNIAHGHAAALCVAKLWKFMLSHTEKCADLRGEEYLKGVFSDIAKAFGTKDEADAAEKFEDTVKKLGLEAPRPKEGDIELLASSVNAVRLKNNPVKLDKDDITKIYTDILG